MEPGDGGSRDNHLKMLNIKTFLIKRTEPLRTRKRLADLEKEQPPQKFVDPKVISNNSSNGNQLLKRLSRSTIHEDENTTDWTPEIPFKNASSSYWNPLKHI